MIAIDHVLLSDQVLQEEFVCDLGKCKGACCVDGDAGAPLEKNELKEIDKAIILLYLDDKSHREIAEITGFSETNVSTKINRVKERLRTKFIKR